MKTKAFFYALFLVLAYVPYARSQKTPQQELEEGIASYRKNKYKDALDHFSRAILLDSNMINAYMYRGITRDAMDDFNAAIADFTRAARLDTNDVWVYVERSQTFIAMKEYEAAESDLLKIIARGQNTIDASDAFYNLARIYMIWKRWEPAVNYFTRSSRYRTNDPELYLLRGTCKFELADYKGCIKDMDIAIDMDDNLEQAYYYRGLGKIETGLSEEGCKDLVKAKREGHEKAAQVLRQRNCGKS